ncbi:MAG: hypothetical protein H6719_12310 [Sandaracinaceae bacterium]|nr:hypothetical protein [Sandaracinaceae bacterium]
MRIVRRFLSLFLLAPLVFGGCESSDHVVLIEVYSQAPVAQLDVTVISLEGLGPPFPAPATPFRPARQPTDLLNDPIRVAIRLPGPATALVHLTASTGDGRRLVATRCYGVSGVVQDSVVLTDLGALDADRDTFLSDPAIACREPVAGDTDGRPCTSTDTFVCPTELAADCNDTPRDDTVDPPDPGGSRIHPGAAFICQNGIDEDCDGDIDEACIDNDGDGVDACPEGTTINCDCNDNDPTINPRAVDVCLDGVDQDCDGVDACCDADGDGYTQCIDPDTFERTGDCIDVADDCLRQDPPCDPAAVDPRSVNPGADEICFDGIDNNCNRAQNEIGECLGPDFDGDGVSVCGMEIAGRPCEEPQYDCDSGISPEEPERCGNGIDDNLNGMVDEGCPAGDMDGDGQVAPRDCNDMDRLAYTHDPGDPVIERCGDGVAQSCVDGEDVACPAAADTDGDGFVEPAGCEGNAAINPDVMETCNGVDDDCNGAVDEVLDATMTMGCAEGAPITFATDIAHCGRCRFNCADTFGAAANVCVGGVCDCAEELGDPGPCAFGDNPTCCSDGCQDIDNDPMNCGGCGVQCGNGEMCVGGRCGCGGVVGAALGDQACPEPAGVGGSEANVCCDGACRVVTVDANNCGGCGVVCGPNTVCNDRICQCDPATPNLDDCNGDIGTGGDGCETNLQTTLAHCGRCGRRCAPDHSTGQCVGGSCTIATCDVDWDNCDGLVGNGCEGNLRSLAHCNGCGMTCSLSGATATCMGRVCEIAACGTGVADCNGSDSDGCETPLGTVMNCASCGDRCNLAHATPRCNTSGRCVIQTCDDGWADCDGVPSNGCEVSIDTNTNCGACGNDCGANAACTARACSCNPRRLDCTVGSPYCEIPFSTSNCGACGATCGVNESCNAAGACACGGSDGGVGRGTACPGQRCCSGSCRPLGTVTNCSDCGDACGGNETCFGTGPWSCRCDGGLRCSGSNTCCPGDGGCVNTNTDVTNCGGCGRDCGAGETCTTGTCRCNGGAACTGGQVCCGAAGCRNTMGTSTAHCGGCGISCQMNEMCAAGACTCGPVTGMSGSGRACAVGQTCCPGSGNCVDMMTDVNNCGGCGVTCGAGEMCSGGRCTCAGTMGSVGGGSACPGTPTCCPGVGCRDLTSDNNNCGMCGMMCTGGTSCMGSSCSGCDGMSMCGGGTTCCSPAGCRNTNNDPAHCGGCGLSCGGGGTGGTAETCSSGICRCGPSMGAGGGADACTAGQACCPSNGGCSTLATDPANCGACGASCGTGGAGSAETCSGSRCRCGPSMGGMTPGTDACGGGTPDCCPSTGCTNVGTDVNNCGACGTVCMGATPDCCGAMGCQDVGGSDAAHCLGCGMACRMGETCSTGACQCNGGAACTGSDICCPGTGCQAAPCS